MPSGSCEAAHPKSSSETVVPPTELKKPDEFAQQTLRDMKATTWTPRVNAHVPKCNASEPSVPTACHTWFECCSDGTRACSHGVGIDTAAPTC